MLSTPWCWVTSVRKDPGKEGMNFNFSIVQFFVNSFGFFIMKFIPLITYMILIIRPEFVTGIPQFVVTHFWPSSVFLKLFVSACWLFYYFQLGTNLFCWFLMILWSRVYLHPVLGWLHLRCCAYLGATGARASCLSIGRSRLGPPVSVSGAAG